MECGPEREWGLGVPYAGWIVIDVRGSQAAVSALVEEHDVSCGVDHGMTRHIFVRESFLATAAYRALHGLGYRESEIADFGRYPAAQGVVRMLGLLRHDSEEYGRVLCLRLQVRMMKFDDLREEVIASFGRDPLELPDVIGFAAGPIPRPNDLMPTEAGS